MKFYSFEIVIEKEPEDEGYLAYSPSLPGCFSNGKTIEETKRNIREAVQMHVASLLVTSSDRSATGKHGSRRRIDGGSARMSRMPQVNARELIAFLKKRGFVEDRQAGSHLTLVE